MTISINASGSSDGHRAGSQNTNGSLNISNSGYTKLTVTSGLVTVNGNNLISGQCIDISSISTISASISARTEYDGTSVIGASASATLILE